MRQLLQNYLRQSIEWLLVAPGVPRARGTVLMIRTASECYPAAATGNSQRWQWDCSGLKTFLSFNQISYFIKSSHQSVTRYQNGFKSAESDHAVLIDNDWGSVHAVMHQLVHYLVFFHQGKSWRSNIWAFNFKRRSYKFLDRLFCRHRIVPHSCQFWNEALFGE